MTKLLVSVRNVAEAEIALSGGADLIYIKEPSRGSLGAADGQTILDVAEFVAGRRPLSAALGDLPAAARLPEELANRIRYAKFGLAGCASQPDSWAVLARAISDLPPGVSPAAVAYADWRAAGAPQPAEVVAAAAEFGCAAVLFDTYDKSGGSLLAHVSLDQLAQTIAAARSHGMLCLVAGGLRAADIQRIVPLGPDYVAVRGAACRGERTGQLDLDRVVSLAQSIGQMARQNGARRRAATSIA